jgi:hypothetical protein
MNSIFFTDPLNGWMAGSFGALYHSADGGLYWTRMNSRTSQNLKTVFFVDSTTGWIMGDNGSLLKTSTGGIVSVDDEPQKTTNDFLKVYQNVPNPFLTTTTIRYELKSAGNVSCKIFNSLGIQVAEPIRENQNAGNYTLDFERSSLPQGIYYCSFTLRVRGRYYTKTIKLNILR